jgi:hypothetical protein
MFLSPIGLRAAFHLVSAGGSAIPGSPLFVVQFTGVEFRFIPPVYSHSEPLNRSLAVILKTMSAAVLRKRAQGFRTFRTSKAIGRVRGSRVLAT